MIILDSFIALEDLAIEYGQRSIADLLRKALDVGISPVIPVGVDRHVVLALDPARRHQPLSPLAPITPAHYIKEARYIELLSADYSQLAQHGYVKVLVVDTIHVQSHAVEELDKHSAQQWSMVLKARAIPATRPQLPILFPVFLLLDKLGTTWDAEPDNIPPSDLSPISPIYVRLSDLRVLPADESKLRTLLSQLAPGSTPAFASFPTTAPHISKQFGQLLEVFNDLQHWMAEQRQNGLSSDKASVKNWLHEQLLHKDPAAWRSPRLRDMAIKLMYPPSDGPRTKQRNAYQSNGLPVVLATLAQRLESDYDKVCTYSSSAGYENWLTALRASDSAGKLKASPLLSLSNVKPIATIIRLTPSKQGGRR